MFSSFDHRSIFFERKFKEIRTKLLVMPVQQNIKGSYRETRRVHRGNRTRLRCEISNDGLGGVGIWTMQKHRHLKKETLDRFQMKI